MDWQVVDGMVREARREAWALGHQAARDEGQQLVDQARREGRQEGLAFVLPCRHVADLDLVRAAFEALWPGYILNGVDVTQTKKESKGACIWTISLLPNGNAAIETEEATQMAGQFRRKCPTGGQFICCGRNYAGVFAKYKVMDCPCEMDFHELKTRFPVQDQPRIKFEISTEEEDIMKTMKSFGFIVQ